MTHFYAVVHKDVGSAYGVTFPDLPGCFSASDDEAGLIAHAVDAVALYAEDAQLPAPSTLEVIRARYAEDLKSGNAFLLAVPVVALEDLEDVRLWDEHKHQLDEPGGVVRVPKAR